VPGRAVPGFQHGNLMPSREGLSRPVYASLWAIVALEHTKSKGLSAVKMACGKGGKGRPLGPHFAGGLQDFYLGNRDGKRSLPSASNEIDWQRATAPGYRRLWAMWARGRDWVMNRFDGGVGEIADSQARPCPSSAVSWPDCSGPSSDAALRHSLSFRVGVRSGVLSKDLGRHCANEDGRNREDGESQ